MSESTPNKDMPVIDTSAEAHSSQVSSDADILVENNDEIAAPEMSPEMQALTDEIVGALKSVYDPEIPVDIYELGLIYRVEV
ncbi:MAG: iron-sulfur cluster assembly protein, partial [Pseudomonadota bacterium]|nr:iron-sulfur cluster assembly protein [Pseudomonadota bacterium]